MTIVNNYSSLNDIIQQRILSNIAERLNRKLPKPTPAPAPVPKPVPTPAKNDLVLTESLKQKFVETNAANHYKATSAIASSSKAGDEVVAALNKQVKTALAAGQFQDADALNQKLTKIAADAAYGKTVKVSAAFAETQTIAAGKDKITLTDKISFSYSNGKAETVKFKNSLSITLNGKKIKDIAGLSDDIKKLLPASAIKTLSSLT